MSFKYRAEKVSDGHYVLKTGCKVPVDVFLSDELYAASEEEAWSQMVAAANFPGVVKVAVTPDTHTGFGVPIGIVLVTDQTIIPTAAGYDIGCGMVQLKTNIDADKALDKEKRRAWIEKVSDRIGVGVGEAGKTSYRAKFEDIVRFGAKALGRKSDVTEREFIPVNDKVDAPERAMEKSGQLGSLGGGNHFCEMQVEEQSGKLWVMIHTGSRGYGWHIANHFFHAGAELRNLPKKDREMCWFDRNSQLGRDYWALHNMAANFAIANRVMIGQAVCDALMDVYGGEAEIYYEISHNLIQEEDGLLVHRKGATRAFPKGHPHLKGTKWEQTGHPVLIPGSMQTGSAILFAKEAAKASCYSVNHGSGRTMSRGQAKKTLDQAVIDKAMADADILINTRQTPLDESGPCYKNLDDVLKTIEMAGLAQVAHRLRPVACIKGND
jgi:tRNA-splicing ligase RtcB (3'-phosphate/5'-hydroxy nucleic acid ligase)